MSEQNNAGQKQEISLDQKVVQGLANRLSALTVDLEISITQRDYYQEEFKKVAQELEQYKLKENEDQVIDKPKAVKKKGE